MGQYLIKAVSTLDVLSGGRATLGIGAWNEQEAGGLGFPFPPIKERFVQLEETLRLVAKYGDACNLFAGAGAEVIRRRLDVLKRHCDAIGRPYIGPFACCGARR